MSHSHISPYFYLSRDEWSQLRAATPLTLSEKELIELRGITEMVLLGNLAIRAGEPVQWDAKGLRSTHSETANRYVRREYRQGWKLS